MLAQSMTRNSVRVRAPIQVSRPRPVQRVQAPRILAPVMALPESQLRPKAAAMVGSEWLRARLDTILGGLEQKTRRCKAQILRVLSVHKAGYYHSSLSGKPRCGQLDLDVAWEAQLLTQGSTVPLQGLARITLTTTGSQDKVTVSDVQVLDKEVDEGVPSMPSSAPAPKDVLLAVTSMDSVIMEQLNDFLWELEQAADFPLASFECEDEAHRLESAGVA